MSNTVRLERLDAVAVLTLDAPEVRNAITAETGLELAGLCAEIDADPAIGAAVVRGARGTFCSGADRRRWSPQVDPAEDATYRASEALYAAFVRVGTLAVPTVAAVRGVAVGAGVNLMLATDLRIIADDARIIGGFLRAGIHPGGGFFTLAGRTAGREAASALGLFSEEIDGVRAQELGMAWRSVPDAEVEDLALSIAARAARDPALARATVRSFRTELGPPGTSWEAALQFERGPQMWSRRRQGGAGDTR